MTAVLTIAGYGFREAVRRKVFAVVLVLTALFLSLLSLACHFVFRHVESVPPPIPGVSPRAYAGAFMLGLGMFGTLFLGIVLAIFLTLGAVRGDAERGLLQPLVVRPIGRSTFLLARFFGAAGVAAIYVLAIYGIGLAIIDLTGSWLPANVAAPGIELAGAVVIVVAISLLGSVVLSSTENGIAVFMLFGAGLVSGLLGSIGQALDSSTIERISTITAWALPFEALYQDALGLISSDATTSFLLKLGPFGGGFVHGWDVRVWAVGYLVAALGAATFLFSRRDL